METQNNISLKRDRFVRIVEKRVNNILKNLDSLSNCSNKRNYEYSQNDVKKIFTEIEKKVKEIKIKFDESPSNSNHFRLEP